MAEQTESTKTIEDYKDLDLVGYLFNTCYGGFGFSDEFLERLNQKRKEAGLGPLPEYYAEEGRTDPLAIQVFQELGPRKSSGSCAKLHLYWVPDEFMQYMDIHEYDGTETVGVNLSELERDILRDFLKEWEKNKDLTVEDLNNRYNEKMKKYLRYKEFLRDVYYKKKRPSEYKAHDDLSDEA